MHGSRDDALDLRTPPHTPEAEDLALGSVLYDPAAVHEVTPVLDPGDFYSPAHGAIYRAALAVQDAGLPIDGLSVQDELQRRGQLDQVGGTAELVRLVDSIPHAGHAGHAATIVRRQANIRRYIAAAQEIIRHGMSRQLGDDQLREFAERAILDVGSRSQGVAMRPIASAMDEVLELVDDPERARAQYLTTGLADLDHLIGGFRPGQLIVIAARPSIGKSALALGMAGAAARATGRPVPFFSLEMTAQEVGARMLAAESDVNGRKILDPWSLDDADRGALRAARARFADVPLLIDDAPTRSVSGIASAARRLRAKDGLGAVYIDYLQLLAADPEPGRQTRQDVVAGQTAALKRLAKELEAPVVLLAQLNRKSEEGRGVATRPGEQRDHEPQLHQLRESGAIEQDANIAILLHRPAFYDPADRPGEAILLIKKNRGGRTGRVRVRYSKAQTRFSDFDPVDPDTF